MIHSPKSWPDWDACKVLKQDSYPSLSSSNLENQKLTIRAPRPLSSCFASMIFRKRYCMIVLKPKESSWHWSTQRYHTRWETLWTRSLINAESCNRFSSNIVKSTIKLQAKSKMTYTPNSKTSAKNFHKAFKHKELLHHCCWWMLRIYLGLLRSKQGSSPNTPIHSTLEKPSMISWASNNTKLILLRLKCIRSLKDLKSKTHKASMLTAITLIATRWGWNRS